MTTNVQESFTKAADLIEKEGWIQGSFHNANGYCLVGALIHVDPEFNAAFNANMNNYQAVIDKYLDPVRERIRGCNPPVHLSVAEWNDIYATKEQVLAVLRGEDCT